MKEIKPSKLEKIKQDHRQSPQVKPRTSHSTWGSVSWDRFSQILGKLELFSKKYSCHFSYFVVPNLMYIFRKIRKRLIFRDFGTDFPNILGKPDFFWKKKFRLFLLRSPLTSCKFLEKSYFGKYENLTPATDRQTDIQQRRTDMYDDNTHSGPYGLREKNSFGTYFGSDLRTQFSGWRSGDTENPPIFFVKKGPRMKTIRILIAFYVQDKPSKIPYFKSFRTITLGPKFWQTCSFQQNERNIISV